MSDKRESKAYAELGASSSKEGVHQAIGLGHSSFFTQLQDDACGDKSYYSCLHSDGAGTKSIVAYLLFRETNNTDVFRSLAIDSLVMNLDDVACVGAFESLSLANTIGRNKHLIPDSAIAAIIDGYRSSAADLRKQGIEILLTGGETADIGDLVRTLVVDSTLFARVKKVDAISTDMISAGDIIVGLSSTGKSAAEKTENSGIGSNGLTLARHALISSSYAATYPEIVDPILDKAVAYRGRYLLSDKPDGLGMTIGEALLSPTRSYAPLLKVLANSLKDKLHGVIHCTGGGQTKILRFGKNKSYIKDALFPCPPIFKLIQESLSLSWEEMYSVFNMGHRMEVICPESAAHTVIAEAEHCGIKAQPVGRVENSSGKNTLRIASPSGPLTFSP